jgi:hypothetical protein
MNEAYFTVIFFFISIMLEVWIKSSFFLSLFLAHSPQPLNHSYIALLLAYKIWRKYYFSKSNPILIKYYQDLNKNNEKKKNIILFFMD